MPAASPHLFVDISSHGFGHLAQAAPILNALCQHLPELRLTVRCGLAPEKLRSRLKGNFTHLPGSSDFGYVMLDAVSIDFTATAEKYRAMHADWAQRVSDEAELLDHLQADLVLTDVAYLPLAGAARAGIPSLSMCSLNWADLFAHFFGHEPWAPQIHREILAAYRAADCFLRLTPAMPMHELPGACPVAPVAALGQNRRAELLKTLGCAPDERLVMIAFGGFDRDLSAANWPRTPGVHWLIPQAWAVERTDMSAFEPLGLSFTDLLCSMDAVLTKPGYGTFTEAACNGTAVLYARRDDWPEQDCLIEWLNENARCGEVSETALMSGRLAEALADLWQQPMPPLPKPTGIADVANLLADRLIFRS